MVHETKRRRRPASRCFLAAQLVAIIAVRVVAASSRSLQGFRPEDGHWAEVVDDIVVDEFDSAKSQESGDVTRLKAASSLVGAGSSYSAMMHRDAMSMYSKQVHPSIFNEELTMEYYGLGSEKGLCRLQGHGDFCDDGDVATPTEGPFAFATSDFPYSQELQEQFPTHTVLPVAASAIVVVYNIPGVPDDVPPLRLDMPTIAKIFSGEINHWRDPQITEHNPEMVDYLPDQRITVVAHSGGSGITHIFKKGLVPYNNFFKQQEEDDKLYTGGPSGWPTMGNGTFMFRNTCAGMAFSILANPFSIGYVDQQRALKHCLQMVAVKEDCLVMRPDSIANTLRSSQIVSRAYLDGEQAAAKLSEAAASHGGEREDAVWPFMGLTYIIIRNETASQGVTCEDMALMAQYMVWFYEAEEVTEIAEVHSFGALSKDLRDMLAEKIKNTMTCGGKRLVPENRYLILAKDLHVPLRARVAPCAGESFLPPYFISFRSEKIKSFKPEITTSAAPDLEPWKFGEEEDFLVVPAPPSEDLPPDAVGIPWIVSSLVVQANLPGLASFHLDLEALSLILSGSISRWNDPRLVSLNPEFAFLDYAVLPLVFPGAARILNTVFKSSNAVYDTNETEWSHQGTRVLASLSENKYSVAVLPAGEVLNNFGAVANLRRGSDPAGSVVSPNRESLLACLSRSQDIKLLDMDREGCYPLAFPVYTVLKRQYSEEHSRHAHQAVLFWYWMLKKNSIEEINTVVLHVYSAGSSALRRKVEQAFLSVTYSSGEPIIEEKEMSMVLYVFIVIASVVMFILGILLAAVGTMYILSQRKLARVEDMSMELYALDPESPVQKIMKYLEGVGKGGKADREIAQELVHMLRHTDNLQAPDLERQFATHQKRGSGAFKLFGPGGHEMATKIGEYMVMLQGGGRLRHSDTSSDSDSSLNGRNRVSVQAARIFRDDMSASTLGRSVNTALTSTLQHVLETCSCPNIDAMGLAALLEPLTHMYFCNVVHLEPLIGNRPLTTVAMGVIVDAGLVRSLRLDRQKLLNYMIAVEDNYPDNLYHNRAHAAFVVQRTYVTMRKVLSAVVDVYSAEQDTWLLAAIIAAAVHDVLHPGFNNNYLVLTDDAVARSFNDQAVLENQSLHMAFELMRREDTNFIKDSYFEKPSAWRSFRTLVIKAVLGTDMSNHFNIVSAFQQKCSILRSKQDGLRDFVFENAALVIQMVVKIADLGHCFARMQQHLYWSKCLEEEMFQQGDTERAENKAISPLMDRTLPGVMSSKSQSGFFSIFVMPMLEAFSGAFPCTEPLKQQAQANLNFWMSRNDSNYQIWDLKYYQELMSRGIEGHGASLRDLITELDTDTVPIENDVWDDDKARDSQMSCPSPLSQTHY